MPFWCHVLFCLEGGLTLLQIIMVQGRVGVPVGLYAHRLGGKHHKLSGDDIGHYVLGRQVHKLGTLSVKAGVSFTFWPASWHPPHACGHTEEHGLHHGEDRLAKSFSVSKLGSNISCLSLCLVASIKQVTLQHIPVLVTT